MCLLFIYVHSGVKYDPDMLVTGFMMFTCCMFLLSLSGGSAKETRRDDSLQSARGDSQSRRPTMSHDTSRQHAQKSSAGLPGNRRRELSPILSGSAVNDFSHSHRTRKRMTLNHKVQIKSRTYKSGRFEMCRLCSWTLWMQLFVKI